MVASTILKCLAPGPISSTSWGSTNSIPSGRVIVAVKLVLRSDKLMPFATAPGYWFSSAFILSFMGFTFSVPVILRASDFLASYTLSCCVSLPISKSPSRSSVASAGWEKHELIPFTNGLLAISDLKVSLWKL